MRPSFLGSKSLFSCSQVGLLLLYIQPDVLRFENITKGCSGPAGAISFGINSIFSWTFCKIPIACWQPCDLLKKGLSLLECVATCLSGIFCGFRGGLGRLVPGISIGWMGSACTGGGDMTRGTFCFADFRGPKKLSNDFNFFSGCAAAFWRSLQALEVRCASRLRLPPVPTWTSTLHCGHLSLEATINSECAGTPRITRY